MAQVIAYTSLNFNFFPFADEAVTYPVVTSTHIQELSGDARTDFFGTGFVVSGEDIVAGTLTSAEYRVDDVLQFKVTGLSHDAETIYDYLVQENANALFSYALSGADDIWGSNESDVMYGFGGADEMTMRADHDSAFGGAGDDIIRGGNGNDLGVGQGGRDVINGDDGNDGLFGEAGNDTLTGGLGHDVLFGGGGADSIKGGTGRDLLVSGAGKDRLEGHGAADTLDGQAGIDVLIGGGGNDDFWFSSTLGATNIDTISDFTGAGITAGDTIKLYDAIFTQLPLGVLDQGSFVSGANPVASDADDFILYDTGTGALFYDADGSGAGVAVQFATLNGSPNALDHTDFEVE